MAARPTGLWSWVCDTTSDRQSIVNSSGFRPGHIRISRYHPAQRPVRALGDSNSRSDRDFAVRYGVASEYLKWWPLQRQSIVITRDRQGLTKLSRSIGEVDVAARGRASTTHEIDAAHRLDR